MGTHYACSKCGLQQCTCYIEDLPDRPFYLEKYCIQGPQYTITKGSELKNKHMFEIFSEKWYDTESEAKRARLDMMKREKVKLQSRIESLAKEISACRDELKGL